MSAKKPSNEAPEQKPKLTKKQLAKVKPLEDSTPGPLSPYTPELADWVCEIVATHPIGLERLYTQFKDQGFPNSDTIIKWRHKHPEFQEKFLNAKRFQALIYMEQAYEIADNALGDLIETDKGLAPNSTAVARAKLQVETRKWVVSRLLPKIYGEKTYVENKVTMSHEEMLKELE